jgi:NAD(P)-dependent dehydrogenase (short-subunit alcohol dehydrogenase family)
MSAERAVAPVRRTVIIVSASSDIGTALVERYLAAGCAVVGTYRQMGGLEAFRSNPDLTLLPLDLSEPVSFCGIAGELRRRGLTWDLLILANGTMEPIGPFLGLDGNRWVESINVNALMPCLLLQTLYPLRRPGRIADVAFFAGGGTNNPFRNYSAYCLSKILLIKMCELLDDETPDLNAFILGPGYVSTKIHRQTERAGAAAGDNLAKTRRFAETPGTSMDDILDCLEWCVAQGRATVGGRNLSVVHDAWRGGGEALACRLRMDTNMFKLRRFDKA